MVREDIPVWLVPVNGCRVTYSHTLRQYVYITQSKCGTFVVGEVMETVLGMLPINHLAERHDGQRCLLESHTANSA